MVSFYLKPKALPRVPAERDQLYDDHFGVAARGTAGGMENGAKEEAPGRRSSSPTHARHPPKTPRIRSPEAEAGGVGQHYWPPTARAGGIGEDTPACQKVPFRN